MSVKSNTDEEAKAKELVHYIISKCSDPSKLGATKLNKILYFTDYLFYMNHGKTITNEKYVKQDFGPVPRHILPRLEDLQDDGMIKISEVPFFGKMKRQYKSLRRPNTSLFTAEELSHIDKVIGVICDKFTASDISELTHNIVWRYAKNGEEIPPFTIFVPGFEQPSEKDLAWASKIAYTQRESIGAAQA